MLLGEFRAQGAQNVHVQTPSRGAAAPLEEKQEEELGRSMRPLSPSSSTVGAQRRVVFSPGVGFKVEQGMPGEGRGSESDASAAASNGTRETARGGLEPEEARRQQEEELRIALRRDSPSKEALKKLQQKLKEEEGREKNEEENAKKKREEEEAAEAEWKRKAKQRQSDAGLQTAPPTWISPPPPPPPASYGTQETARGGVAAAATNEAKEWQRDAILQSAPPKSSPPPSPRGRILGGGPPTWSPPPPPSRLCFRNLTSESQLAEAGQQRVENAETCGRESPEAGDVRGECVRKGEQILARVEGPAESGRSDSGPYLFI
jgi:hypothetical protein